VTTRLPVAQALPQPCHAPSRSSISRRSVALALTVRPVTTYRGATTRRPDCTGSTAPMSCIRTRRLAARLLIGWSHWLSSCVRSLRLAARLLIIRIALALLCLCRASGCLGTSRGSSSTTSPTPCVRVRRHIARLVTRLAVDYLDYAARQGASARRATRRAVRRQLRLRHASGCLGTSRGSSRDSSSTTSPTPRIRVPRLVTRLVAPIVVDYFTYTTHSGASARRAARHAARRRLLRLVVDYFSYAARPGASPRRAAHRATRRRLLRLRHASECLGMSHS
jgi:hypothetical protein